MTYRKIHLYFKPGEKFNPIKTCEIFKCYLDGLKDTRVKYLHFNHYTDDNRITIRFEFDNKKADENAEEITKAICNPFQIERYEIDGDESVPVVTKAAGRFASMCFYELITKHRKEYFEHLTRNSFHFTMYFIKSTLEKLGYESVILDDALGPYSYTKPLKEKVNILVDACIQYAPSENEVYKNPNFLERFIHLYLNSSLLQLLWNFENDVWKAITLSQSLNDICKSYKKK